MCIMFEIFIPEYTENDPVRMFMPGCKLHDSVYGDTRRLFTGETVFSRGNAGKSDAVKFIQLSNFKAGPVAGRKLLFVFFLQAVFYHRSRYMNNVFTGKIIGRGYLGASYGLIMPLFCHYLAAL